MFAVIFEFQVKDGRWDDYYSRALALRPEVDRLDGFLEIERFASRLAAQRFVSFSLWRDEAAIAGWRGFGPHRDAQAMGRAEVFEDYRLRVGEVVDGPADVTVSEGRNLAGAGELFDSIVAPGKMLLIGSPATGGEVARCLGVRVVRDYGMRQRGQAPS